MIFLIIAFIFIGSIAIAAISEKTAATETEVAETTQDEEEKVVVEERKITEETESEPVESEEEKEETSETEEAQTIEKIEFYLDGPKDSGIFLGETAVGIKREDIKNIYGSGYLNSGFEYNLDFSDINLSAGLHTLFIYAVTDKGQTSHVIKEITVQGDRGENNARINVDNPLNLSIIKPGEIDVQGWALNPEATDNSGIDEMHIYLDG
ncbi:MAG: hypothetical protein ACQEP2_08430, partial [Actinomycetota bacterium]